MPPPMSLEESIAVAIGRATTLDELALTLERLIAGGFSVWSDGSLIETRQLVAWARGLRIEIRPREHAPPHFHVCAAELDASFAIEDGRLLKGSISARHRAVVTWWYGHNGRSRLVAIWNTTRPADCPVGPIPT